METGHSDPLTEGLRIRVAAEYQPAYSSPEIDRYVYAYRVVLINEGEAGARLESRHWIIRDGNGERTDVRGDGVVGEHPDLAPGESFEYISSCPLSTRWGTMEGTYRMMRPNGSTFDAEIGRFFLAETALPLSALDD